MGKNSYENRASSSSFKFNGVVRVFEYWCPRICACIYYTFSLPIKLSPQ